MIQEIKNVARKTPFLGPLLVSLYGRFTRQPFVTSPDYWERRYRAGGNSGDGSYGRLAEFKAEVLNRFVADNRIETVIEFGCGDGNNLSLAKYPSYVGLDVATGAIEICKKRFANDPTKSFYRYDAATFVGNHRPFHAQLALSLDVIYHLVEDQIFAAYVHALFGAADNFVIVYSSDFDAQQQSHVRHRRFTVWVAAAFPQWRLVEKLANRYPFDPADTSNTSAADFFFFEKA